MESYNARVEVATRQRQVGDLIDRLIEYHPAVSCSAAGWLEVIITVAGESIRQVTATAVALVEHATDRGVLAVEVMTTAEFDIRIGCAPTSQLIGVTEAACGAPRARAPGRPCRVIDSGPVSGLDGASTTEHVGERPDEVDPLRAERRLVSTASSGTSGWSVVTDCTAEKLAAVGAWNSTNGAEGGGSRLGRRDLLVASGRGVHWWGSLAQSLAGTFGYSG